MISDARIACLPSKSRAGLSRLQRRTAVVETEHRGLVDHQQADSRLLQKAIRHPAEHPFAQPAMSITSCNNEVGAHVRSQANEIASIRLCCMHTNFVFAAHSVLLEIASHIPHPAMRRILLLRCADFGD